MQILTWIFGFVALLASVMPFIKSERWWIRGFDYPKPQILIICIIALVLWLAFARDLSWMFFVGALLLALACAHNALLILPFTAIWRKNVADADDPKDGTCIDVLIANVEMENTDTDAVIAMVNKHKPDILFIAEADQRWVDALETLAGDYRHVTRQPQENYYGLMFMTNLEVESVETRFLLKDDMPSIKAMLKTPNGRVFTFYGMHPEPPVVGKDSDQRDAELMLLAKELKDADGPVIVGGDLNDVAWSHTTREFKRISNLLDPRVGRGLYASFHARYWFMRWPLDHLFNSTDFTLDKLALLDSIGSDHFPVYVKLCMTPNAEAENDAPDEGGDLDEADRMIEKGRANA